MFKKLKEKLDETGLKNKILDYAANASSGGGEASSSRAQTTSNNSTNQKESSDNSSSPISSSDQGTDVTVVDWSVKGEPPPIGWAPPAASPPPGLTSKAVHPSDTEESEADDLNTSLDGVSKEKLLNELTKWHARYQKVKAKYTQRVNAYKELNYEKEKIQTALAETQDRLLRRQAELREQCILEQQAKAHLEQNLRVTIEEKDQLISVLETKVDLLKDGKGFPEQPAPDAAEQNENIEELHKKVKRLEELLNRCRATLNSNKEQSALMKKQLEEKDKEVKHALEQEIKLKERLLFLEQEVQKECKSCRTFNNTQQTMQQTLNDLQQQLNEQQGKCKELEEEQRSALNVAEEKRLLKQQLEATEKNLSNLANKARTDLELKKQSHAKAVQAFEEKCHALELQVEDLQAKSTEKNFQMEQRFVDMKAEKERTHDELNFKCQQIEGLMQELKRESEETVQLKVQCSKLESAIKEKEEESEQLCSDWRQREEKLREEANSWKEKYDSVEEKVREMTTQNETLRNGKTELEKALQLAQDNTLVCVKNLDEDHAVKIQTLQTKLKELEVSSEERATRDSDTINSLTEKCDKLANELRDKVNEHVETVRSFENEKEKFDRLERELQTKEEENSVNISSVEREIEELRNLEKEFRAKEDWQKQVISSLEEKCTILEGSVQNRELEQANATEFHLKEHETLSFQLNDKDRELAEMNALLEAKQQELKTVCKERDESLEGCHSLDIKCQNLIGQLSSIQNDSSQTIQELQSKCVELQTALDQNKNARSEQFGALEAKCTNLREQIETKEKEFAEELQTWKERHSMLETTVKQTEDKTLAEANTYKDSIRELTERFNYERSREEERVKELELDRDRLGSQLEEYNRARLSLEEKYGNLETSFCSEKEQYSQRVKDLEAKCESLRGCLTTSENQIQEMNRTREEICKNLRDQLQSQTERYEDTLSKLDLETKETTALKEKEAAAISKSHDLEERCSSYDAKLQENENSYHVRVSELQEQLSSLQKEHEEKSAACSQSESQLKEERAQLKSQLAIAEDQLRTTVSLLEQKLLDLETSLRDTKRKNEQEKERLEETCQLLEDQLRSREGDVNETVRKAEEKCQELQFLLQKTNQERTGVVEDLERKCQQLEKNLTEESRCVEETSRTWESKYSQLETLLAEKEVENSGHVRRLEEREGDLRERTGLVATLQGKCGRMENEIQEFMNKIATMEEGNRQTENLLMERENELTETRMTLDEKIHQTDVLKEAEMKFFDKTQLLEQQCLQLESQLEEREESSSVIINNLKSKCQQLEESLMEQSNVNNRKTTQLQEKCQRLEIQLKDIEEDSAQTIRSLEERCQSMEEALQSRDVPLLNDRCHNLQNEIKIDGVEEPGSIENYESPDTNMVANDNESHDVTDSLKEKCILLTEQERKLTSEVESLQDRLSDIENMLAQEQNHGFCVVQRLSQFQESVRQFGGSVDDEASREAVPVEWQCQAETLLNRIERTLANVHEDKILPEVASVFENGLTENPSQAQIEHIMKEISKQMQKKDVEHRQELRQAAERAEAIEQKFMQQETVEMRELAQEIEAQTVANEEIREHFILQIQEKDAEIQALQKQLQTGELNKKSDWDNAWDMEEDEMCNNAPVQNNLVSKELQAVMNENKADLDQLERFLSYPSNNSTTPKLSLEPTEYEYLRNILLAYMTGREPLVMAKVITAVLRFPEKDTQEILRREALKSSAS